jgi:hypothetical protein
LYHTLVGDPMYEAHRQRPDPDSTEWAIYSPDVPVFRTDDGTALEEPWLLSFITCAAPYAPAIGQPKSGDLLQGRIHRVLAIARAFGHSVLVLGAWGCGAFANDPRRTARDFRQALEGEFRGVFSDVVFGVTDSRVRAPEKADLVARQEGPLPGAERSLIEAHYGVIHNCGDMNDEESDALRIKTRPRLPHAGTAGLPDRAGAEETAKQAPT